MKETDKTKCLSQMITTVQMNTPIYNKLRSYARGNIIPFHMPGHKMGRGFPCEFLEDLVKFDITEIPGTDNLHFPDGIIKEAQELAAIAFGTDKTYFLVNGSSCGIHASIMSVLMPGDRILVPRDCHRSVIGGIMMAAANPVYINTEFDNFFGISTIIKPNTLEKALIDNPDVKAVIITRPNYYGICSDVQQIAKIAHSFGKILIVDEAHGAHLKFNKTLPVSAIEAGADISIQSAHKTLPALTQGAYLHVKSNMVDLERLEFTLRLLQTTSPSYIIMASLDIAREIIERFGDELLEELIQQTDWVRHAVSELEDIVPLDEDITRKLLIDKSLTGKKLLEEGAILREDTAIGELANGNVAANGLLDKTRLVFNTRNLGITGYTISQMLKDKYSIQIEMADMLNIVCICTIADNKSDFEILYKALSEIVAIAKRELASEISGKMINRVSDRTNDRMGDRKNNRINDKIGIEIQNIKELPMPKQGINLSEISRYKGKYVILNDAVGKVSRDFIVPYPPGVPVTCPGEIITKETIEYICDIIEQGGIVNGVDKNLLIDVIDRSGRV